MDFDQQRRQRRPEDDSKHGGSDEGGDTSTKAKKQKQISPWLLLAATAAATFSLVVVSGGGRYGSVVSRTTVEQRTSSSPSHAAAAAAVVAPAEPAVAEEGTVVPVTPARLGVHASRAITDDHQIHHPGVRAATSYLPAKENDLSGAHQQQAPIAPISGNSSMRCFHGPQKPHVHHCLANIYFFGVSKCGTTSLSEWMVEHPMLKFVYPASKPGQFDEVHLFDFMSPATYSRLKSQGRSGKLMMRSPPAIPRDHVMDYTPHYATVMEVPYRIRDLYGSESYDGRMKYLVALREPVSRAISSWMYKYDLHRVDPTFPYQKTGRQEQRVFEEAVEEGLQRSNRLLDCIDRAESEMAMGNDDAGEDGSEHFDLQGVSESKARRNLSKLDFIKCKPTDFLGPRLLVAHVAKGLYAVQLRRWFTLFGHENMKVVFLEDVAADPIGTLKSIFSFLGMDFIDEEGKKGLPSLEAWKKVVSTSHNEGDQMKKNALAGQVTPELRRRLEEFYAPQNAALEELLGVPLPKEWVTSSSKASA